LYLLLVTGPQVTAPVATIELLCKPRLSEVCGVLSNSLMLDIYQGIFVTPNILTVYVSGSVTLETFHSTLDCARKLQTIIRVLRSTGFFFFFLLEPYLRKT